MPIQTHADQTKQSTGRIVELRYSKANDRQLWVPLIEKAYAKVQPHDARVVLSFD